jgi:ribosomal peptide maturation radical SAM protein 1
MAMVEFTPDEESRPKTAVLVMPFGLISFPDIGVSSLKAFFQQHGYPLDVKYCNLEFAYRIGVREYQFYANVCNPYLVSEYPFAKEVNPALPDFSDYLREVMPPDYGKRLGSIRGLYHDMLLHMESVIKNVTGYLDDLEENLDLSDYEVIGFTTSFAQNSASWALARRLRLRYPDATIVFGGANCEGAMGQAQADAFDFIDYVCTGEGEIPFLELVKWLGDPKGHSFPESGIVSRRHRLQEGTSRLMDVKALPPPNYDDYFAALERHGDWRRWYYAMPMESSRGCWWGQKNQCVFCGCNGLRLSFREKPAEQFVSELWEMRERYGEWAKYIQVVDNIMPHNYFDTFFPLVTEHRPYDTLFYEIKANLRPEQIRQLRDAGVKFLQPGVESLSTPILKLMRKGITAIGNVQTLKYATENGIWLVWSILCGVPGEEVGHYEEMASLIPKLYHLNPPRGISEITIDRHSPLHRSPTDFGLEIQPARSYTWLYGLDDELTKELAYWFEDKRRSEGRMTYYQLPEYVKSCQRRLQIWKNSFLKQGGVRFDYEVNGDALELMDTRTGEEKHVALVGVEKSVAEACCRVTSSSGIVKAVESVCVNAGEQAIRSVLDGLVARDIVMCEGDRYLFLALDKKEMDARVPSGFWLEKVRRDEDYLYS